MQRQARTSNLVLLLVLTFAAGCSDSSGGSADDSPSPSVAVTDAAMQGAPEVGTCRPVPLRLWSDPDVVSDDTPTVPCSERHTAQTVAVYPLPEPTVAEARKLSGQCHSDARLLAGIGSHTWLPHAAGVWLPTPAQVEAGASWGRCDLLFPARTMSYLPTWRDFPADDAFEKHGDDLWGCLDRDPASPDQQAFVDCDRPHVYEATGDLVFVNGPVERPTAAEKREATGRCRDFLDAEDQGLAVVVQWDRPGEVVPDIAGSCWVFRRDGAPLPPR